MPGPHPSAREWSRPIAEQPDGLAYFLGALYHTAGRFSSLSRFIAPYREDLSQLPYSREAVAAFVSRTLRGLRDPLASRTPESTAEAVLRARDLQAVRDRLADPAVAKRLDARADLANFLERTSETATRILIDRGLAVEPVPVFVCDRLPQPYSERLWAVLAADSGDEAEHGIRPGLYFRRDKLRPLYSEFLVCHEMVHVILGQRSPELIARGLEEGMAEIVGGLFLSSRILGPEITHNLFVYNRLSDTYDRVWEIYLDATRRCYALLAAHGLKGLLEMLAAGREAVKAAEDRLSDSVPWRRRAFGAAGQPADPELWGLATSVCLTFPRASVLPPLALYLADYATEGASVAAVAARARLPLSATLDGLQSLATIANLVGLSADETEVVWSDCQRPDVKAFRYEPSSDRDVVVG